MEEAEGELIEVLAVGRWEVLLGLLDAEHRMVVKEAVMLAEEAEEEILKVMAAADVVHAQTVLEEVEVVEMMVALAVVSMPQTTSTRLAQWAGASRSPTCSSMPHLLEKTTTTATPILHLFPWGPTAEYDSQCARSHTAVYGCTHHW